MKKTVIFAALLSLLVSCAKTQVETSLPEKTSSIGWHLALRHPGETKAVKSGWEAGDIVYVFFSGAPAPRHLQLRYDGTDWTPKEMNGGTEGSVGLSEGDSGTMRAVYLPFGSGLEVSSDGASFRFSDTRYSYYLTAALSYTVSGSEVCGHFDMALPEGFVQFFVADDTAVDGSVRLGTDAVIPVGIQSIGADGTLVETSGMTAGDDMPGFAYEGGYLFSGKMVAGYSENFGDNYYFAKTRIDGSREDYFVAGKALASGKAVKLPAHGSGKWQPVGLDKTVDMGPGYGVWYTCNAGASVPEGTSDTGMNYASARLGGEHRELPGLTLFNKLKDDFDWKWISVHGQGGMLVSSDSGAFLLFPAFKENEMAYYWLMRLGTSVLRTFNWLSPTPSAIEAGNDAYSNASDEWLVRYIYTE